MLALTTHKDLRAFEMTEYPMKKNYKVGSNHSGLLHKQALAGICMIH